MTDFTPQVETAEIADADLDNVSGGVLGVEVGNVVGLADSVLPVSEVTGLVEGVTGVSTAPITGAVTSL
ncbi:MULTISPECIES: type A2 lantipeptide [Streptomyces]|uniref:Type A2 lantipeptide n=1 Tax=Streptomyces lycii TaxID=2654337 RepID=A0ABQ7FMZ2_9ACTN|nr:MULTISPECIES: type A2 lantipeptide [Streptomyces]KAF4410087.1 type A2 lantipeptide [Streptomyces lycii]PGH51983.1 type A2 lantipeptide [Streptomyces sp. Ru87]